MNATRPRLQVLRLLAMYQALLFDALSQFEHATNRAPNREFSGQAARPISISQLHALLRFHL
jgi:hypothetical protein